MADSLDAQRRHIQELLAEHGAYTGPIDGILGPESLSAIESALETLDYLITALATLQGLAGAKPPKPPKPGTDPLPEPDPNPLPEPPPDIEHADWLEDAARWIIKQEALLDAKGNIAVYYHPGGSGSYEIAGIDSRYHPALAADLRALIEAGQHEQVEAEVIDFIVGYTDRVAVEWGVTDPGVDFFLRDSVYNRGPTGGAKILQMALNVEPDGKVGPITKEALRTWDDRPEELLADLREAREQYEIKTYGKREQFWEGLENRWDGALAYGRGLQEAVEPGPVDPDLPEPERILPASWLPPAVLTGVILHWTGGTYEASDFDRKHYHMLVEGDGDVERGTCPISGNSKTNPKGAKASHTKNLNTGWAGVSMCCMAQAVERPPDYGKCPLNKVQWDKASGVVAELCARYKIPVTDKTVLSHAEVEANLGVDQVGKWDVAVLPFDPSFNTARKCGDRFRKEVAAKLKALG